MLAVDSDRFLWHTDLMSHGALPIRIHGPVMFLVQASIPKELLGDSCLRYVYWQDVYGNEHSIQPFASGDNLVLAYYGAVPSLWEPSSIQ